MSESENDVRHRINVTDIKDAILAEYNVLRGEIQHYHGERTTHMNFAVGVTVGLVALLGSERLTPESQSWMLALSPYFYAIIASLFLDRSIRIIRLADYIENDMRPRLEKLLQSPVWEWEKYKRETHRFPRWVPRCLDRLRLLVFVGPAGGLLDCLVSAVSSHGYSPQQIAWFRSCCPYSFHYPHRLTDARVERCIATGARTW